MSSCDIVMKKCLKTPRKVVEDVPKLTFREVCQGNDFIAQLFTFSSS